MKSIPIDTPTPVLKLQTFFVKQKNINNNDQKVNQSKTEKETDLVNANASNKATQSEKTLDVVPQDERKNNDRKNPEEMVDQNAFTSLPDPKATIQDNQLSDTNGLALHKITLKTQSQNRKRKFG